MRKTKTLSALMAGLLALGTVAPAHEGHEHKVMGKVVAVDDKRIEVETSEGKKVSGVLSTETKYTRDKAAATLAEVKVGARVVMLVVEDKNKVQNVKEVLLETGGAKSGEHKH